MELASSAVDTAAMLLCTQVPIPLLGQLIEMEDMAAKVVQDEQTAKKVAVVGGGLVRISVKVPGRKSIFILDNTVALARKIDRIQNFASSAELG